jgi:uncharacterized protein (DUF1697 family)
MNTLIALLRGINVGGNNLLPMKELTTLLTGLGLHNVKSYIQSGNVVLQSDRTATNELSQAITAAIKQSYGFAPYVLILEVRTLQAVITANPFPEGEAVPKSLHLFFMDATPQKINGETLERLKAPNERYQLIDKVFYLHTPDGIGRSKLAEAIGKGWGVNITARNWRTVTTIMTMAAELEEK